MRGFVVCLLVLLNVPAAWAAKLQVEADQMQVDGAAQKALFSGHVQLRRGAFELNCDKLETEYKGGFSMLENAVASGNVKMTNGDVRGSANRALLNNRNESVTLIGDAEIEDAAGQIHAERISHHIDSGRSEIESAAAQGGEGRVNMRIDTEKMPKSGKAK